MNKKWLYRTIHGYPDDKSWYFKLLSEVVKPFVDKNNPIIDRFFFTGYCPRYMDEPCGSRLEQKFDEPVAFYRLRIRAENKDIPILDNSLLDFINQSSAVRGTEPGTYDVMGDLGKKFGANRVNEVINYLDSASRLSLTFQEDKQDYNQHVLDAIHLVHNIMGIVDSIKQEKNGDYIIRFRFLVELS